MGRVFGERLRAMAARHSMIKEVRGIGLIWGLELDRDAAAVVPAALERGVVVNRTAEKVVRLLPPLVMTEAEALEALGRLDAALGAMNAVPTGGHPQ
jgi:acetylornithine/succinyldiaminopimelate/putrescine aminotransferase